VSERKVKISAIEMFVPERKLTNQDLEKMVDTTNDWIMERTGIHTRYIVEKGQAASDLGAGAIRKLCAKRGIDPSEIDMIVVPTVTPDMFFPSTACVIQEKIGAKKAWGFDLLGACSGFIFALSVAEKYVRTGIHDKVGGRSCPPSSIHRPGHLRPFGDAAGAALLERLATTRWAPSTPHHVTAPAGTACPAIAEPPTERDKKMHYVHQRRPAFCSP
jgi:3-oxoacyl-[acyl-carrier-protein] synthase-3